jgi:hypothetical protein
VPGPIGRAAGRQQRFHDQRRPSFFKELKPFPGLAIKGPGLLKKGPNGCGSKSIDLDS